MDCSPPGSSVHGILQARILEWIAISFSRGSSRPRNRTWVSSIGGKLFVIWASRETTIHHRVSGNLFSGACGVSGPWTAYSTAFQSLFTSWNLKTSELCPCVYYLFCWNLTLLHFSASCLCVCVCVKSLQLCPILCDLMDCSLPSF